ncbi:InlB B-repeat-containing protein, partial [Hominilimicola sp.]|uniref:InlB B-repeat-containing protein n=1 Tax=Hominilimicola sp. TaxID=3073571 RepID=UPI00307D9352
KDKEYKGLSVKSDSLNTIINGVNFTQNTKIPMELSSENVTLDRVTVDCSGYALVLKADNTNISLNRSVNLISTGENAVISKSVTLAPLSSDIVGKLNLTGNMLVRGKVDGEKYLSFNSGEIKYISDEEYNNYLTSHRIIFNASGGTVSETSKMFALNTEIGELPVPSRDYYTFDGWYTDADGGDKVTAKTVVTSPTDFTLYAHWIENDVSAWTLASEVPEDAQIVNRKWTYKQTSYTTSGASSLSGWTKYDTQWRWSDYGNWSSWSNNSVGSSDSRQVETRTIYKYHYYQCNSCFDHHPYCVNRCDTCGKVGTVLASSYGERWEPVNPYSTDYGNWGRNHMWTYFGDHWWANLYFWDSSNIESATQWRYRDRSKVYTYYYKKTESKEASTEPSGDNITNVQEYVQYRSKDTNSSEVKKYKYYYYQCSNCYDHHPYCVDKCETCGKTGTVKEDSYVERWESVDPYDTDHGSWGENYMWTYFGEHWYANLYFWDSSNIVSTTL